MSAAASRRRRAFRHLTSRHSAPLLSRLPHLPDFRHAEEAIAVDSR